jgi:two-component system CheB/CheR fusion protein
VTPPKTDPQLEALIEYIKSTRGFDFTGYKRASLARRTGKRMQSLGLESYGDYLDYLEGNPDEFVELFDAILINVTSFFRDREAWDYLREHIVPQLTAKKSDSPIRVWCAGSASGEEAYSIAILLAEALGSEQFRERVKVYATDLDEDALGRGRAASFTAKEVENVPEELRKGYFDTDRGSFTFSKDLRRSIIFGHHDLVQDAPISKVDLLICRNTLMYFNAETQARVLAQFNFALNEAGFLFLGRSEMLLTRSKLFTPVEMKHRIFTKAERSTVPDRILVGSVEQRGELAEIGRGTLLDAGFEMAQFGQVVLDEHGLLVLANQQARSMFGITLDDLGRPLQDLEFSYRPLELRSLIDRVYSERRTQSVRGVEWPTQSGGERVIDVQISPLVAEDGHIPGTVLTFVDVSTYSAVQRELEGSKRELETAYEELQTTVEELETTNEELQSTNEELETTNEELQSTNEELETMNEELHSTNEELETVNEELRGRTGELNSMNTFLESILTSLGAAVVVLDPDLQIRLWNEEARDLWGLDANEVRGQHFMNLDIGLEVERLKQPLRKCLNGGSAKEELTVEAVNRRGKTIQCHVTCSPLKNASGIHGALILMEDAVPQS